MSAPHETPGTGTRKRTGTGAGAGAGAGTANAVAVARLPADEYGAWCGPLGDVLADAVDGGASLGFLAPFTAAEATAWWRGRAAEVAEGRLRVWVAVDADGRALGTVGLVPAGMPNGRHRAEITKLAVRREARRQGLARRLLATAEHAATADGVTLLVLDTETGSAAERLYAAAGWQRLAEIPEYATDPAGVPRGTTLYTKRPLPDPGAGAAVTVTEAPVPGLAGLLGAYHLATEAEKGVPVAGAGLLPARYRAEVTDPRAAFGTATVLTALDATGTALGCVVLTRDGEVKRLWTDPAARGRGTGAALLDAAVGRARSRGADVVRLTVWRWRAPALALYAAYGFRPAAHAWDDREGLVCLELPL